MNIKVAAFTVSEKSININKRMRQFDIVFRDIPERNLSHISVEGLFWDEPSYTGCIRSRFVKIPLHNIYVFELCYCSSGLSYLLKVLIYY